MAGLGNAGEYLSFTNTSKHSCRIDGWPTLALIDAQGHVSHSVIKTPERPTMGYASTTRAEAFILRPRQHADAAFGGSDGPTTDNRPCRPSYRRLKVGLPGSTATRILPAWIPRPRCVHARLLTDRAWPPCAQLALYHG